MTITPTQPPPRPSRVPAFNGRIWLTIEQGRRAWAIREAVRLHAGHNRTLDDVLDTATDLLEWVEDEGGANDG